MEEQIQFIREQLEMLAENKTIKSSIMVIRDDENTYVHIVGGRVETLLAMSSALRNSDEFKSLTGAAIAVNEIFKTAKSDGGGAITTAGRRATVETEHWNPYLVDLAV